MSNVVIDMSPLIYASYFTLHDKMDFWMVFGVVNSILTIIEEERPETLALVWGSRHIDKRKAYPLYKSGSKVKIDFDQKQFQKLQDLFTAFGACQLQMDGLEADQVLAAYVNSLSDCTIISDDKDFFQLLTETRVLKGPRRGFWDASRVVKEYNLKSSTMFADWQALTGDQADTIPRILRTHDANYVLKTKGFLKDWLLSEQIDLTGIPERITKKIQDNIHQIRLNYMLTNLLDERLTEGMFLPTNVNLDYAKDRLTKMQMNIFVKKFDRLASIVQCNLQKKREIFGRAKGEINEQSNS